MYVEAYDELICIMVRVTTNIAADRGRVWAYLSECINRFGQGVIESVSLAGEIFQACGPLKTARNRYGTEVAVSRAAAAAVLFAKHIVSLPPPAHFTVVLSISDAYGAVIGSNLLSYNVFGPAVRTAAGILTAAPVANGSCAIVTAAFRRRSEETDREGVVGTLLVDGASNEAAMSRAYFISRPAAQASDNGSSGQRSASQFTKLVVWRIRGLGLVQVCALKQENPLSADPSDRDDELLGSHSSLRLA
jgi:hypothetical protein